MKIARSQKNLYLIPTRQIQTLEYPTKEDKQT
jgi:hypothetical protein